MSYAPVPAIYTNVTYKNIVYGPYMAPIDTGLLPQLDPQKPHKALESAVLDTSDIADVIKLTRADARVIHELCEAEYANSLLTKKPFLIRRSLSEIQGILDRGMMFGVRINGRLAAVGGSVHVDDETKMGRGNPYKGDGDCSAKDIQLFKCAAMHPSLQGKGLRLMPMLYPHRICGAALSPERQCLLTKTNNSVVKKFYGKGCKETYGRSWEDVDSYRLPEADDPEFDLTPDEENLVTYKITVDEALDDVKKTRPDVYALYATAIEAAHAKIEAKAITMKPPVPEIAVNDNVETKHKLVKPALTFL